ncbi:MAG: hypothetical protein Q4F31_10735 [Eubacteriales bacterium]|nr:hypothetical protein [Eubacteriales bacterium]
MKTPEELNTLKEEVADMKKKLSELTDDELSLVTGGVVIPKAFDDPIPPLPSVPCRYKKYSVSCPYPSSERTRAECVDCPNLLR